MHSATEGIMLIGTPQTKTKLPQAKDQLFNQLIEKNPNSVPLHYSYLNYKRAFRPSFSVTLGWKLKRFAFEISA